MSNLKRINFINFTKLVKNMKELFRKANESKVTISKLMLPSYSNFRGNIHGGYILSMLDEIAFTCACKHSGSYCVTASVDTVNFLQPIEIGNLVTMKASVNFAGISSMIIGIRVESENIQTEVVKHCNSSYFTMVAKDLSGNNTEVPGLILTNLTELKRYYRAIQQIKQRKEREHQNQEKVSLNSNYIEEQLKTFKVKIDLNSN